jgi:hypothetical protein
MKHKSDYFAIRKAIAPVILGFCLLQSGCKGEGSETIWSAEARSPGGNMLASARTVANSGFGTGYIWTAVYLNSTQGSQPPTQILGLSDTFERPADEMIVEINWITPTHLELTYKGHRALDFQAVKCAGIDISVRDLSSGAVNPSK